MNLENQLNTLYEQGKKLPEDKELIYETLKDYTEEEIEDELPWDLMFHKNDVTTKEDWLVNVLCEYLDEVHPNS